MNEKKLTELEKKAGHVSGKYFYLWYDNGKYYQERAFNEGEIIYSQEVPPEDVQDALAVEYIHDWRGAEEE